MSFPETIVLHPGEEKIQYAAARGIPLGQRAVINDRVFRWTRNGATALSTARLCQESVIVSGHGGDVVVQAAAAVGARTVTITNNTTAMTANMYAGGYMWGNDEAGEGPGYRIKSHPAIAATANGVITLEDDDTIRVALTTVSQVGFRRNLYDSVVVNPTTPTGVPVGVTCLAITADYYFWLQTWGPAAVLGNGTLIVGYMVSPGATTAGSVDVYPLNSVDGSGQQPGIGRVSRVAPSTEFSWIDLQIAP